MSSPRVLQGDALEVLRTLEADSVVAVVTDPPYGLGFMGKAWDQVVPAPELWAEVLRVAKPGAPLLAFGGTRTFHRLACAIEDAGFEIRDCLSWLYGQGFPKSLDVSRAIDRAEGMQREIVVGTRGRNSCDGNPCRCPENSVLGRTVHAPTTAPASALASAWSGWGTALKPAWEPILLGMKPCDGTFAENAARHGVAGLHIDGVRIEGDGESPAAARRASARASGRAPVSARPASEAEAEGRLEDRSSPWRYLKERAGEVLGRWPANVILDEEAAAAVDEQTGELTSGLLASQHRKASSPGIGTFEIRDRTGEPGSFGGDAGGASRFFYCAKVSPEERGDSKHPTMKPVDLLRWLCRLVKPPGGGLVLDPFAGSGSTGVAAVREGLDFVGIEREAEYVELARRRIAAARLEFEGGPLFGGSSGLPDK